MLLLNKCVQSDESESDKLSELDGLKEFLDNYKSYRKQRDEEYLEFSSFLCDKEDWDQELIIIKKVDWNEFYSTDDEDYEMKISGWVQASEFYNKFKELVGIGFENFEECFVSAKYIDEYTYNTIELIVRINNENEVFIIDAV